MIYLIVNDAHSLLRWIVILACLWALIRMWGGLIGKREWAKADKLSGLAFSSALNLQVVLGLILYAVSPLTQAALGNFRAAIKEPAVRFFVLEHPVTMILAAVIAQVGYSMAKGAAADRSKFLRGGIAYLVAAILVLASIPWPFLKYGRPLLPGM